MQKEEAEKLLPVQLNPSFLGQNLRKILLHANPRNLKFVEDLQELKRWSYIQCL